MNSGPELVNQSLGTWNGTHWATAPSPAGIFDRLQLFSVGTPPSQSLYLSVEYDNLYVRSGNTWNVVGGPFGYHRSSVTRFDLLARGEFWGEGTFTRGAPKGRFPLAIALSLADTSAGASGVPPQGARGNLKGYLK